MARPTDTQFDAARYPWRRGLDYRATPDAYRVGKGEQGVFACEPYNRELKPLWRFKTPELARASSSAIYEQFLAYLVRGEFVGADLARKYLQMGYTRARRYANYRGGRKYHPDDGTLLPRGTGDPSKAESARIFYDAWQAAEAEPSYARWKAAWRAQYG